MKINLLKTHSKWIPRFGTSFNTYQWIWYDWFLSHFDLFLPTYYFFNEKIKGEMKINDYHWRKRRKSTKFKFLFIQNFECLKIRLEKSNLSTYMFNTLTNSVGCFSTFHHAFPSYFSHILDILHSMLPSFFSFTSFYHFDILSSDIIWCAGLFTTF